VDRGVARQGKAGRPAARPCHAPAGPGRAPGGVAREDGFAAGGRGCPEGGVPMEEVREGVRVGIRVWTGV
jgi:hypothetical protein